MPHGTPDWGLVGPKRTVHGLDDLGEHAVRLGSAVTFDRRGDVMWWTDFRDGLGDVVPVGTAGHRAILVAGEYARQGPFCLDLYWPGGIAGASGIRKYLPYPVASRMGIEATFRVDHYNDYWRLEIYIQRGARQVQAGLRYDYTNDMLEVQIGALAWEEIARGMNPAKLLLPLVTAKMVVDIATDHYVRAFFNDAEYNIATIACYEHGHVSARYADCRVLTESVSDDEMHGYVDSIIITQNEP